MYVCKSPQRADRNGTNDHYCFSYSYRCFIKVLNYYYSGSGSSLTNLLINLVIFVRFRFHIFQRFRFGFFSVRYYRNIESDFGYKKKTKQKKSKVLNLIYTQLRLVYTLFIYFFYYFFFSKDTFNNNIIIIRRFKISMTVFNTRTHGIPRVLYKKK